MNKEIKAFCIKIKIKKNLNYVLKKINDLNNINVKVNKEKKSMFIKKSPIE